MPPCNCHPPFPRPEPFSPLPRPGKAPDWGKWIRDRLAEKGALLVFPTRAMFPEEGAWPNLYLDRETGAVYRWENRTGYAVLVDPREGNDVLVYDSVAAFPDEGEQGKLYIAANTGGLYRWGGGGYVALLEGKADKAVPQAAGNFAALDGSGNLTDSGKKPADFATAAQGAKADTAVQSVAVGSSTVTPGEDGALALPVSSSATSDSEDALATPKAVKTVNDKVTAIEGKIPAQATAQNQLADKAFVNSSISTNTATFRGTYNLVTDLELTVAATQEHIATAISRKMEVLSISPDNNDYCFVQIPTGDETPTEISRVDRYKCVESEQGGVKVVAWAYEWSLNNSSFTAAQWAAINSGITSGAVAKLNGIAAGAQVNVIEAIKVNGTALTPDESKAVGITYDNAVTRASTNSVKSSGIWSAIWGALTALPTGFSSIYDWCVAKLRDKTDLAVYELADPDRVWTVSNMSAPQMKPAEGDYVYDANTGHWVNPNLSGPYIYKTGTVWTFVPASSSGAQNPSWSGDSATDVAGSTPVGGGGTVNYTLDVSASGTPTATSDTLAKKSELPVASDADPAMDGDADPGSSNAFARGNHRHPSDTSKADKASPAAAGNLASLTSDGGLADSGKSLDDVRRYTDNEVVKALKPTHVYNAGASDRTDDKGGLATVDPGQSVPAVYTINGNAFEYYGFQYYQSSVQRHMFKKWPNNYITYEPNSGLVTNLDNYDGGWHDEELATIEAGLDPRVAGLRMPDLDGVTVHGCGTGRLAYTPKEAAFAAPYAHFALEEVPNRAIAASTAYAVGDLLGDAGRAYRCVLAYTSAATPVAPSSDSGHWKEVPVLSQFRKLQDDQVGTVVAEWKMRGSEDRPFIWRDAEGQWRNDNNNILRGPHFVEAYQQDGQTYYRDKMTGQAPVYSFWTYEGAELVNRGQAAAPNLDLYIAEAGVQFYVSARTDSDRFARASEIPDISGKRDKTDDLTLYGDQRYEYISLAFYDGAAGYDGNYYYHPEDGTWHKGQPHQAYIRKKDGTDDVFELVMDNTYVTMTFTGLAVHQQVAFHWEHRDGWTLDDYCNIGVSAVNHLVRTCDLEKKVDKTALAGELPLPEYPTQNQIAEAVKKLFVALGGTIQQ